MLTVTEQAAEKLKNAIEAETTDTEVCIRIVPSPSMPNELQMVLDKENDGDHVVENEGVKVLLLSPDLAMALEQMVIDWKETPQGGGFTISEVAPDA